MLRVIMVASLAACSTQAGYDGVFEDVQFRGPDERLRAGFTARELVTEALGDGVFEVIEPSSPFAPHGPFTLTVLDGAWEVLDVREFLGSDTASDFIDSAEVRLPTHLRSADGAFDLEGLHAVIAPTLERAVWSHGPTDYPSGELPAWVEERATEATADSLCVSSTDDAEAWREGSFSSNLYGPPGERRIGVSVQWFADSSRCAGAHGIASVAVD